MNLTTQDDLSFGTYPKKKDDLSFGGFALTKTLVCCGFEINIFISNHFKSTY